MLSFFFILQRPVVITGSKLAEPALKWNLDYLQEHLGKGESFTKERHLYNMFFSDGKLALVMGSVSEGVPIFQASQAGSQ